MRRPAATPRSPAATTAVGFLAGVAFTLTGLAFVLGLDEADVPHGCVRQSASDPPGESDDVVQAEAVPTVLRPDDQRQRQADLRQNRDRYRAIHEVTLLRFDMWARESQSIGCPSGYEPSAAIRRTISDRISTTLDERVAYLQRLDGDDFTDAVEAVRMELSE